MATTATVRPANDDDAGSVVALLLGGSRAPQFETPEDPDRYVRAMARIRDGGGEVLVAELDGVVVGVLQLSLLVHLQHAGGTVAEIESVHVAAARRRSGVGRALLGAAVEWARVRGCYRVQLTSHTTRDGAHRFYEAIGFEPSHVGFNYSLEAPGPGGGEAVG
jgi:GNAT superfamily N-acetyltransferase